MPDSPSAPPLAAPDSLHSPLAILLAHDCWATGNLLTACLPLTDAQLDREFPIGPGTLRKTLIHLLDVTMGWDEIVAGRPDTDLEHTLSVAALQTLLPTIYDNLSKTCSAPNPPPTLLLTRRGRTLQAPRNAILTHLLTHGTHHRAQALNILRQLSIHPLPKSSVLEWMLTTGVAKSGPA